LALIQKQFANGLTPDEATELQGLQRQADQNLESLDGRMLDDVAQMELAVVEALDDSKR